MSFRIRFFRAIFSLLSTFFAHTRSHSNKNKERERGEGRERGRSQWQKCKERLFCPSVILARERREKGGGDHEQGKIVHPQQSDDKERLTKKTINTLLLLQIKHQSAAGESDWMIGQYWRSLSSLMFLNGLARRQNRSVYRQHPW